MDATKRVGDLIVICNRLSEILEAENRALMAHKADIVQDLLDEKNTLARAYESRLKGLTELGEDILNVDKDLLERLKLLGLRINEKLETNAKLLKIAMESNRRVVKMVAEAVKEARPGPSVYSSAGTYGNSGRSGAQTATPLSLDRAL